MLSFNIIIRSIKQAHGFTCEGFGPFTNDDFGQASEAHGNHRQITLQEALDLLGAGGERRDLLVSFEDGSMASATLTDNGIELDVEATKKMLHSELHSELMAYEALQAAIK